MKEKPISLTEKISASLSREFELPNLFSETDIRLSASQGLSVCGIEEVEEYTRQRVVFKMRRNKLVIEGEDLQVDCCENGMAVLHGCLLAFTFSGGGAFLC